MADNSDPHKSAKVVGRPNFSGYWRQIKNENMDAFLQVTPNFAAQFRGCIRAVSPVVPAL